AALRPTAVVAARMAADAVPNAWVVFVVVGAPVTPTQLRGAAAAIPPGIRTFAISFNTGPAPARARIADQDVITVGAL
ncbi:hypothetical protein M2C68_22530, partial [Pseudomonas sp. BAgro211]|nr:hypothetical protein [Pseudomonas sp. BAgro211]